MFSVKFVIEKKENKQKEAELGPFKKNFYSISIWFYLFELFQHDFDFKSAPVVYSINPLINSTAEGREQATRAHASPCDEK